MNQLHEALRAHSGTPDLVSKANLRRHYEQGWFSARTKTIEQHGNTADIVLAAVLNMERRTRTKIITEDQYNLLISIAAAAQGNLDVIYSSDPRCQVLHSRLAEAHRNISSNLYSAF